MKHKTIIDLIKEELEEFDFLSHEERLKEQEDSHILANEDFQKQFITDSLIRGNDKIKFIGAADQIISSEWETEWNVEDINKISITYNPTFEYTYDSQKPPVKLQLYFDGTSIPIHMGEYKEAQTRAYPGSLERWFDFVEWDAIEVGLLDSDGDDYEFTAFEKAPHDLQTMFIKHYVGDFINNKTNLEIRD